LLVDHLIVEDAMAAEVLLEGGIVLVDFSAFIGVALASEGGELGGC
jgi:hypothetical protein